VANPDVVKGWGMVVVAAAIGIGVVDALQMTRIEVADYIFRKSN
jgi:hypothetical protein